MWHPELTKSEVGSLTMNVNIRIPSNSPSLLSAFVCIDSTFHLRGLLLEMSFWENLKRGK